VSDVKLQIMPAQRIGLIGPNGAGKSTLIKYLAGELQSTAGESWQAQDLKIGYFAQHQLEQLDLDLSALDQLRALDDSINMNNKAREQDLRNYLGSFGFQGERIDEPVRPFSGGEKARLVLALLVYQKPNLLLLDEPTNHLDLQMRHALSVALQGFVGAMVIVSHDRHLLKTVTDELIIVHDGKAEAFDGDLEDYALFIKDAFKKEEASNEAGQPATKELSKKEQRQLDAERRKKLQPLRNKIKKIEVKLDKLTTKKEALDAILADPDSYLEENKEKLKKDLFEKSVIDKELDTVEVEWMELSETYESGE
jgi:ATP-binding cassette subfamily F protein 3